MCTVSWSNRRLDFAPQQHSVYSLRFERCLGTDGEKWEEGGSGGLSGGEIKGAPTFVCCHAFSHCKQTLALRPYHTATRLCPKSSEGKAAPCAAFTCSIEGETKRLFVGYDILLNAKARTDNFQTALALRYALSFPPSSRCCHSTNLRYIPSKTCHRVATVPASRCRGMCSGPAAP